MTTVETVILHIDEIVSNPDVRGGQPVLKDTGLRVSDLVAYHIYGDKLSPEQLAQNFWLSLGQVYAALAYYHLHKSEIDAQMKQDAEETEKMLAQIEQQGKLVRLD